MSALPKWMVPVLTDTTPIRLLEQRGLAHAVAAKDHLDLADLGFEADTAQNVRATVVLVDALYFQHGNGGECFTAEERS